MSLRERVVLAILCAVAITAVLVGGAGWVATSGALPLQALAVAASLGCGALLARLLVQGPMDQQVERIIETIRQSDKDLAPVDGLDPELRHVEAALGARTRELSARAERSARDARMAMEVLETSPFGIATIDSDGTIITANPTFRGMFRLRGEPAGRRPIEVVPVVEIHELVEEALAGRFAEQAFVTASLDLVARAQPLSGGRAIVRLEDVTGRREAERARTDFVANVTHELRTPLTAIMGYLETVMMDAERIPGDLYPLLEVAERNARRLRDLFEDLLRLHRIEARRRELPLERLRLLPLLEEAVAPARDRAGTRGQTFELVCPDALEGVVNPEALTAIVRNLAGNASAYTPEGGRVVVQAAREPDTGLVRIDVTDDGIGIAERHHERIFERFYRVDEARSRRVGGTGLGLAIVKHFALASGCNVTLRSREGEGSTFTVHLPDA